MRPRYAEQAPMIARTQQPRPRQGPPPMRVLDRRPNWWLRLTSYGWDRPLRTVEERERSRHSRLLSWIILGLLVVDALLVPLGLSDQGTLIAIASVGGALLVAIVLNRVGQVTFGGALLVSLICAADILSLVTYPGGLRVDELPTFDLLAVAVVVAASILPRGMAFIVAAINIALICLVFFQLPHSDALTQSVLDYGGFPGGDISLLARPVGLQILIAVVAYLWVRGTDDAIRRADRAEELAALEHQLADQKRQLDIGIQELLATHIRAANGDFGARAPLRQENILWQIASSLNNLLARMQRTAQAEHRLVRTEEELRRIAGAIDEARAGRPPFWPMPAGTAADLILERIARDGRHAAIAAGPSQPLDPRGFPGGFGVAAVPSRAAGGAPYAAGYDPSYVPGYGQGAFPAGPSQPLDPRGFPGSFGAPVPPSGPMGQPPYFPPATQAPTAPLGQLITAARQAPRGPVSRGPVSQANDLWPQTAAPQPARPSTPSAPVPPAPWMLSQDELAHDTQDRTQSPSQAQPQDAPPDWPELPPVGQWTIPADSRGSQ